jgi:AraC-like DNA-binding protein
MSEAPDSVRKPLDTFAIIRTHRVDEMQDALDRYFGESKLGVAKGYRNFSAHGNYVRPKGIGLSFGTFGTAVDLQFRNLSMGYTIPIVRAGGGTAKSGTATIAVNREQTAIFTPGRPLFLAYGEAFETFNVQLDTQTVASKLASFVGFQPTASLVFESTFDLTQSGAAFWRRLLEFFIAEIDTHASEIPETAIVEMEQALVVMFLQSAPNNYDHLLNGTLHRTAPWQVRRVEEYIEANWQKPITIEILAAETNASARSIFQSFKVSRGYSPMAFARHVRLCKAKAMLSKPDRAPTSVTEVAYTCGFSNLGSFAREYRRMFGELPSETLKTSKGNLAVTPPYRKR